LLDHCCCSPKTIIRTIAPRTEASINRPKPMGLFYTGEVLLGLRLGLAKRERLARVLGSSCHLFRLVAQRRSM